MQIARTTNLKIAKRLVERLIDMIQYLLTHIFPVIVSLLMIFSIIRIELGYRVGRKFMHSSNDWWLSLPDLWSMALHPKYYKLWTYNQWLKYLEKNCTKWTVK